MQVIFFAILYMDGLNSKFSFLTGCLTKAQEPSLPYPSEIGDLTDRRYFKAAEWEQSITVKFVS